MVSTWSAFIAGDHTRRVSLVTAQRAAEKCATRADRAEAEAQEVYHAATVDREAAASAAAATEAAQQRVASLQTQLDVAVSTNRERDTRVKEEHAAAADAIHAAEAKVGRCRLTPA